MKELPLTDPITDFDGTPLALDANGTHLTIGNALVRQLALAKSEGEAAFLTFDLGRKLVAAVKDEDETLLVESAEFDHLITCVAANNAQFVDLVQAQVRRALDDAPEVNVKKAD